MRSFLKLCARFVLSTCLISPLCSLMCTLRDIRFVAYVRLSLLLRSLYFLSSKVNCFLVGFERLEAEKSRVRTSSVIDGESRVGFAPTVIVLCRSDDNETSMYIYRMNRTIRLGIDGIPVSNRRTKHTMLHTIRVRALGCSIRTLFAN